MMSSVEMDLSDCPEGLPPRDLKSIGIGRILNRKIISWSEILGTCGMSGLGFFGVRLSKTQEYPKEWLILPVRGSGNLVKFDGRAIEQEPFSRLKRLGLVLLERSISMTFFFPPIQWILLFVVVLFYRLPRYLRGWSGMGEWDNLSRLMIGATVTSAAFAADSTIIQIRKKETTNIIGFHSNLSKKDKMGKMRVLESHLSAWVISKSGNLWFHPKPNPSLNPTA